MRARKTYCGNLLWQSSLTLLAPDYGNGETERFAYDKWNRLAKHTRGRTEEMYRYDHFGRLVEKKESGIVLAEGNNTNNFKNNISGAAGELAREDGHAGLRGTESVTCPSDGRHAGANERGL